MSKVEDLKRVEETGIVAVVRAENAEKALKITEAVKKGGIDAIEITMTVPGAVDVIKQLTDEYSKEEVLIGAGSVLDAETARACILAGAEYIVSPSLDEETIAMCNRYQKAVMPGAMSVTEVVKAMKYGADIVKIFPATLFGPKIIKAVKGPLPQAPLMPTGGVSLDNVKDWIKAGSLAVGVGSSLSKGAKTGDYEQVTETAKEFIRLIKEARAEMA
ncbi:bifunctional 2-keto-4-hydroxyglutarate aldolase/2-keto-3-deoxy-6-phosphogluconate aldolase [Halanaerobium congolense]|jgi:2-dehydro-3-deoxyphosphogluconate aldolase/(4S)-4-hydroxy-2-oxoglutarate aldolase|uniref:2-dehydro-3-deoxyphosphogluconate aldolase/(4S)-4-hydroxy-2-oxoglutarate aldolase n=1 Tax=Halanaerobium congolense TaxID=54121 RepID=A0A1G8RDU3_9FIRM|nr:bifunctional 2-keto-4-hydroxyglutarate aldolase/2-keto-3-deoxy-6-phosphogluconate aldolase [Halanaerobium congolense]PUU91685.1 MAG: 2-dehydro-3-deoxyphosphogluconate aldolase / 4-hydroxy-2-oxoglutarate aldolase [Halanaerobium sp.]PTX15978.1 2-keto-3-deoxy-phosphogluconate aldolase [Halanaerobium congolense]TDX46361.1 2-dehydro-3-deoxyphosphogluconate aldolase/(4S)-4-hydroxy-2-oxoglutarate aldolase [Halanaerobium congolense]SDF64549.1 2-keto-3-deoxy-phosphogluconate aldolase [Halanaerobium c